MLHKSLREEKTKRLTPTVRDKDMSNRKLQNLFRSHLNALDNSPQPLKNRKAIQAITQCRTPDMGVSYFSCQSNHKPIEQYHSCRNRSCYLCSPKSKHDWVEKQKDRLLNVPHFHVIFTLPHEYLNLWRYNEQQFSGILFKASQQTLLELLSDPKHHGVTPGLMIALHTWGRQLTLHPHTHCLITAGGVNANKEWQNIDKYLLPIRVVKKLYRGKVQSLLYQALDDKKLILPPDMTRSLFYRLQRQTYQKVWSVRIEERYEHGKGVMLYLSRYLKGGPVKPEQIHFGGKKGVNLRYLDHRDKKTKQLNLTPPELIRRILEHVSPVGMHTVRYFGIYASTHKARELESVKSKGTLCDEKLGASEKLKDMILSCKTCGERAYLTHTRWRCQIKAFSINKANHSPNVQQGDVADLTGKSIGRLSCFSSA